MIYFVIPTLINTGGVKVMCRLAHLCITVLGTDATVIVSNGNYLVKSPWNFSFPIGIPEDIVDLPENKVVFTWGPDVSLSWRKIEKAKKYYLAQDMWMGRVSNKANDYMPLILGKDTQLITMGFPVYMYWLYYFYKDSSMINDYLDTRLFSPKEKIDKSVAFIRHKEYYIKGIADKFENAGYNVFVAEGSEIDVARTFSKCKYFIAAHDGQFNGFTFCEAFPGPPAEAMACGCVTLSKDTHGVRAFLLDKMNGFLFDDYDVAIAMLDNIEEDPLEFARISENAVNTFRYSFTKSRTASELKAALKL